VGFINPGTGLFFQAVTHQVLSLLTVFTFVFGMGTGVFRSLGHQELECKGNVLVSPAFLFYLSIIARITTTSDCIKKIQLVAGIAHELTHLRRYIRTLVRTFRAIKRACCILDNRKSSVKQKKVGINGNPRGITSWVS
jgi:hypothetical protein